MIASGKKINVKKNIYSMKNILDFNQFSEINEAYKPSSGMDYVKNMIRGGVKSAADFLKKPKVAKKTSIDNSEYWTLITIMACENFSDQKQGMSDTAQSIYNRLAVPNKPYGKTIKEIILAKGQYEPVSVGKKRGADWNNINSKDKAITVYMKTKKLDRNKATAAINNAILAQKDPKLAKEAGKHVQSRTEFLADKPKSGGAAKPVERQSPKTNNAFFWNYAGKTRFYAKNDLAPKPKPGNVNVA
jgi:hypothetical protein